MSMDYKKNNSPYAIRWQKKRFTPKKLPTRVSKSSSKEQIKTNRKQWFSRLICQRPRMKVTKQDIATCVKEWKLGKVKWCERIVKMFIAYGILSLKLVVICAKINSLLPQFLLMQSELINLLFIVFKYRYLLYEL